MAEYRIDDLARRAGTTARNVRVYQESGLLPRPQRRGRVAIYTDRHLRQLEAIIRLLGEGFTVKHILKFLDGLRRGEGLAQVLDLADLGELVVEPWSHPVQATASRAELEAQLGPLDEGTLGRLVADRIIEETEVPQRYLVADQRVTEDFAALISRGMPLPVILETTAAVDAHLDEAARVLAAAGHTEVVRQRSTGWYPGTDAELAWAADLVDTMRRVARRSAQASLDRALDQAVRTELRRYQEHRTVPTER
ncbi:MerR family transcriptional regulator [Mycolicibacterium bacteremicum]|uniref:MerR family transcriptional regulator n=1 Tax=Mycolicibacterium bacteremicum TaxID=564198 RepID=A0A1W9YNK5_MYCBA|nr:MerR family transcriptional regulator [Mycolicibacterium bacteremicum]MCV7432902.1 MerR family transcriptional regulator [Mycolicibacterium bacteremicum]ORA01641.1 MerR family transcriptional regulator [Mycolicibacterium bacteremicum]